MNLYQFLSDLIVCPMCSDLLQTSYGTNSSCPNTDCPYQFRKHGIDLDQTFVIYIHNDIVSYGIWIYHDQIQITSSSSTYIKFPGTAISIQDFKSLQSLINKINLLLAFQ